MGTSVLYQSIELLSQEKGIDPGIVVGAVEEAIALATRKYYKTQENMRGELNKETGQITAYIYKTVVADADQVEDPVNQITLDQGKREAAASWGGTRPVMTARQGTSAATRAGSLTSHQDSAGRLRGGRHRRQSAGRALPGGRPGVVASSWALCPAALHRPHEHSYAGAQKCEVGEHLDDRAPPGRPRIWR